MASVSSRSAGQTSASSSKRFMSSGDIHASKKTQSSSDNSTQQEKRHQSSDSRHKSGGPPKASSDDVRKKSLSTSSSLSQQRQHSQNGAKHSGFDFSSLMQQASSNSADASQKITQIDISTIAKPRISVKPAKTPKIDVSAVKLRKVSAERSSVKHSTASQSIDSKHSKERGDVGGKDLAKRQNSTSGSSDKHGDRREKQGEKPLSAQKNHLKEKEMVSKSSAQSTSASSSKQPLPGDLRARAQSQSSKSLPNAGVGQQQKRHLPGDSRYKGETAAAPRVSADKKVLSKPAPSSSSAQRQHQQNKRPTGSSGMDFNKLMQQASSNINGKTKMPMSNDSEESAGGKSSLSVPAGKLRGSSPERLSSSKHSAPRQSADSKYNSKERSGGGLGAKDTVKRQSASGSSEKNYSRDSVGKPSGTKNLGREEEIRGRYSQTSSSASTSKRFTSGDNRARTQSQPPAACSSTTSQPQQGKRYLPGDARYTGGPAKAAPEGFGKKPPPSSAPSAMPRQQLQNNAKRAGEMISGKRSRSPPRPSGPSSSATVSPSKKSRRDSSPVDDNLARIRARQRLQYEMARRAAEEDVDDEEDEYDSEMDDFIDDTEVEDLQRRDFEETLRLINPRYNKEKWKRREMEIDEHKMVASYRDITAEEKRSARLGLIEDVKEAQKGRSIAL